MLHFSTRQLSILQKFCLTASHAYRLHKIQFIYANVSAHFYPWSSAVMGFTQLWGVRDMFSLFLQVLFLQFFLCEIPDCKFTLISFLFLLRSLLDRSVLEKWLRFVQHSLMAVWLDTTLFQDRLCSAESHLPHRLNHRLFALPCLKDSKNTPMTTKCYKGRRKKRNIN